ncbi:MAG: tRNA (adenosine(37)-N6)-threonylcarbamoyltransferase complex transferase subunit TsaD [Crocinitomicaceae bacterium]|nr:tRNA (adenosine(37)-N6)-threonylcarbamoyltransferase complex transferase subunit TsaD [Crocinitomicaceae bacterium]
MTQKEPIILAIESSCDDTSAAVLKNESILSNLIAGQDVHRLYGGVVPELASRAHLQNILPVVDAAIEKAGIQLIDIDAIAFTKGPGLLGSLIVGTSFAKSLSMALDVPLIDVNHMYGHVLAHFIDDEEEETKVSDGVLTDGPIKKEKPKFPFICLTVSGGHTQIILVKDHLEMEIIGTTIDDAAGEAFDKAAKMLGFEYPGGPLIDKHSVNGAPLKFTFTRPKVGGYDFSFSGLKTGILYFLQKQVKENPSFIEENLDDLCASIQFTIVDILIRQLKRVTKDLGIQEVAIAGGVSANSGLRKALTETGGSCNWNIYIPRFEYCTDNAAMIAITAKFMFEQELFADQTVTAMARVPFAR